MKKQISFNWLIIYYFILLSSGFYTREYGNTDFPSFNWLILMLPICIFIGINITSYIRGKYSFLSIPILIYLILVLFSSLIRGDINTAFDISIWCLPIIIIFNSNISLDFKLLNILFLFSILLSIIFFYTGANQFGFLPTQTTYKTFYWKVTLGSYNTPLGTGFLSLLTLISNYFYNNKKYSKTFFILISLYFIILSGSRITIVCLFIGILLFLINRIYKFRNSYIYKLLPIFILVFFISFTMNPIFLLKYYSKYDLINTYIFHEKSSLSEEQFIESLARPDIWKRHFKIFSTNPIIGVGNFNLRDYFPDAGASGSESALTYFLARDGIFVIFLIIFLYLLIVKALKENNLIQYFFSISFIIIFLGYGSVCSTVIYTFLMMLAFFNSGYKYKI